MHPANFLRFTSLFVAALLVGTMFAIWVGLNPADLSYAAYLALQQHMILALNVLMPLAGAMCIGMTLSLILLSKGDSRGRYLLGSAVVCLLIAGGITRFGNQPINALVMTWRLGSMPSDWLLLRDAWWHWHILRTVAGLFALGFLLCAAIVKREQKQA